MLVMDEATSALTTTQNDASAKTCGKLKIARFFVTHRLSTVRNADKIVMMHQGSIVEVGNHEELVALKGRYYALMRQQEAG